MAIARLTAAYTRTETATERESCILVSKKDVDRVGDQAYLYGAGTRHVPSSCDLRRTAQPFRNQLSDTGADHLTGFDPSY